MLEKERYNSNGYNPETFDDFNSGIGDYKGKSYLYAEMEDSLGSEPYFYTSLIANNPGKKAVMIYIMSKSEIERDSMVSKLWF